jgi:RNA polymerase sigma-70 factor (ECF subfamily)
MSVDDQTTMIQGWINRLRSGDESAREFLLAAAGDRLAKLARKMIRDYPGVARWEQADDVLQNALVRLDRALQSSIPPTSREFFRLAGTQIRRELIDLARHYYGPRGLGTHHSTCAGTPPSHARGADSPELTHDPSQIATWTEFHERIGDLPDDEREMFDLLWYQGVTQAEAAEILGLSHRQVGRRWIAARLRLSKSLNGRLPL